MQHVDRDIPMANRLRRLRLQVCVEVAVINIVAGAVLAALYRLSARDAVAVGDRPVEAASTAVIVMVFVAEVAAAAGLMTPLVRWLRNNEGSCAPRRLKIGVIMQPILTTLLHALVWLVGSIVFAFLQAAAIPDSERSFLIVILSTTMANVTISAIIYLRIERAWRPFVPTFFIGDDPTELGLPRMNLLRGRMRSSFILGSVIPLLAISLAVVSRDPRQSDAALDAMVLLIAIGGLLGGGILMRAVRRSVTGPIQVVAESMERVRRGDLDFEVSVDRTDALGRLESGFNAMAGAIRQRRALAELLRRHVGAEVAQAAIASGSAQLGGEIRVVSTLFVDLDGFSTIAEELDPAALVEILNRVFAVVVGAVRTNGGLVNKFQGDAALAIFGAPVADNLHARHAAQAAVDIAQGLEALDIEFGIGLSTGDVFAGNIGAVDRMEYTVIGDAVNVAARLQELTRSANCRVLLSDRMAVELRIEPSELSSALIPMRAVTLRGRSGPTGVLGLDARLWRGDDNGHNLGVDPPIR